MRALPLATAMGLSVNGLPANQNICSMDGAYIVPYTSGSAADMIEKALAKIRGSEFGWEWKVQDSLGT
jgi:tripartite-type tricarboxylate transporter receptor subunit TctC